MEWIKKKRRREESKKLSGSFTVELAGLMPVIFLVIFGIWSLSFYMHHKVWLAGAAYEAATVGAAEGVFSKEKALPAASLRAKERLNEFFEGNDGENVQVVEQNGTIQVCYRGQVTSAYGGLRWEFQSTGRSKICRPTEQIRKLRLTEEMFGRK